MKENILTFTDENGEELELEVVDSFEIDDNKYVALATPETDDENDEGEVYIMRIESESDGEDIYVAIEDEDELNTAFEKFTERCSDDFDILSE